MVFGNVNALLSPATPVQMPDRVFRRENEESRAPQPQAQPAEPVRASDPAGIRGRLLDISV